MSTISPLFVTCPRGLENVLAAELTQLNVNNISTQDGGVLCQSDLAGIYRINLHARTAGRVLLQLAHSAFRSENDIYALSRKIDWQRWFSAEQSFKIRIEGKHAQINSLNFAALKVKDALCDYFRDACGQRPNVDKAAPDIRVYVFIERQHVSIYLDSSGEALFKRGYRGDSGDAPMRENLAAGLLLAAGYDGSQAFMDPFCGSGTIAIEAAWIASRCAPGLNRRFGFEAWRHFDAALWQDLRHTASKAIRTASAPIHGSDIDSRLVRMAEDNAANAEVSDLIHWQVCDAIDTRPNGDTGILISNPPYGVRLSEIQALHALYPQLGSWLKQYFSGWLIGMFTADRDMPKLMRLNPKRKIPLFNGNLDCRLFLLDMVTGSNRNTK
ncbi:THUMP domain-containing class I SAM-dependent RNA methyltransferase [Stenoxybacter acetivorans]|uniref:THUMP domain-containing class I SAM-dependent RNA methyltransferase n=1 Tax=Stenoxybacter acetivorans TaxID=422441 RepID=UPI0005672DF8|nr:THUMP domain-containing protein [Stenoxybacter acetivorans]